MVYVEGMDVAEFLGRGDEPDLVALAELHVPIVTALAKSYTRDRGFVGAEPTEDVAAVITTATARLVTNPTLDRAESIAGYSVQPGVFLGWTLAETFVLNRYRKRAA